jgi:hypothetical protein
VVINQLQAFLHQVQAFLNAGKLSSEQAQLLIDAANAAIISALPGSPLLASGGAAANRVNSEILTPQVLQPLLLEAKTYWSAVGVDAESLQRLDKVDVYVSNLPGAYLGVASSTAVWIDQEAAGYGWYVDESVIGPSGLRQGATDYHQSDSGGGSIAARMDLLSVVTHEVGHVLGFGHSDAPDVMGAHLRAGTVLVRASRPPLGEPPHVFGEPLVVAMRIQPARQQTLTTLDAGARDRALLSVLNDWSLRGRAGTFLLNAENVEFGDRAWRGRNEPHGPASFWADDDDDQTETDFEEVLAELLIDADDNRSA